MYLHILQFISLLAYAFSLGPVIAHAAEMPNKMKLGKEDYLTTQKMYVGWHYFGFPEVIAIVATLLLTINSFGTTDFWFRLVALLAITGTLAVFVVRILPINKQTANWSKAPTNWQALRTQWEYGHALNCALTIVGLVSLLLTIT